MALELTVLLMNEMDLTRDFGSDEGHLNSYSAHCCNSSDWTLGRARNGAVLTRSIPLNPSDRLLSIRSRFSSVGGWEDRAMRDMIVLEK